MSIKKLQPLARRFNNGVVKPESKWTDPFYLSQQYRAWRTAIVTRAGFRCEAVDDGIRCTKAWPEHKLIADHVVERQDGGSDLDPTNGIAVCYSHHALKTMRERAKRLG